jgi:hypothetical protein
MYGDTAQEWDSVVAFYDGLARENAAFRDIASLAGQLAISEYRVAGLQVLTSMHDLLLGPSKAVLDNPFLRVAFKQSEQHFVLTYEPGGLRMATQGQRWSRTTNPDEAYAVIERFLTRRARWFRQGRARAGKACGPTMG